MFSPYYAWARSRGRGDPENHCALNIALYGRPARWAMTERGRRSLRASADTLRIGPSSLHWDGNALDVRVDEITAPIPSRLRGRVRLHPTALCNRSFLLDEVARHRWHPISPVARVDVAFERPRLRWQGDAYLDANAGTEPLEAAFDGWHWSRARLDTGAAVLYDVRRRDGSAQSLALRFALDGRATAFEPPPVRFLRGTGWGLARATRSAQAAGVVATLEDAPFYTRSLVSTELLGEKLIAFQESLSLQRFRAPWVRCLLPFRMPRWSA